jgi:hypothetical protein
MKPRTIASITAAVVLAGCGLHNPDTVKTPPPARRTVPVSPSRLRTPPAAVAVQRDVLVRVAVDYTLTQATWSSDTYVAQQAHLASLSTGQALAELVPRPGEPPAAVAAQLAAAGSSSQATLLGTDGPTPGQQVIVAYKATATGIGRSTGRLDYAIAHVTLTPHAHGWLVSAFAIQP